MAALRTKSFQSTWRRWAPSRWSLYFIPTMPEISISGARGAPIRAINKPGRSTFRKKLNALRAFGATGWELNTFAYGSSRYFVRAGPVPEETSRAMAAFGDGNVSGFQRPPDSPAAGFEQLFALQGG